MAEALRQRKPRERNKDYMGEFIAHLPCLICGDRPDPQEDGRTGVHVCHVRFTETCPECKGDLGEEVHYLAPPSEPWESATLQSDWRRCVPCQATGYRYGKRPTGAGEKPSDWWCWPGCPDCHLFGPDAQHSSGERQWWAEKGIDILYICTRLQDVYNASKSRADALQAGLAVLENVREKADG